MTLQKGNANERGRRVSEMVLVSAAKVQISWRGVEKKILPRGRERTNHIHFVRAFSYTDSGTKHLLTLSFSHLLIT